MNPYWKGGSKLSLFAKDVIICVEKSRRLYEEATEPRNELSETVGHRSIQESQSHRIPAGTIRHWRVTGHFRIAPELRNAED